MTVLAKYQRLEAEGIWRATPDAQRRDVIVAIGDATLTISSGTGTALTHWSLPAIERLNPGARPALYRPGAGAQETLEIAEAEMIDAVEQVLRSIQRGGASPNRLRRIGTIGVVAAVMLSAALWLPGAITRYTASLVPDVARATIGAQVLAEMDRVAGAPCQAPSGLRSLEKLEKRLFKEMPQELVVFSSTLETTAHLPGQIILVSHTLVEDYETPDALAGYLLAEELRQNNVDPLARLLDFAGLRSALGLLLQGKVSKEALKRMAEGVVAGLPPAVDADELIDRMEQADVSPSAYGRALDFSGETTAAFFETGDFGGDPVLEDGDWIALQRICED